MKRSVDVEDINVGDHLLAAYNANDMLIISDYYIKHEKELKRLKKLNVKKATLADDSTTDIVKNKTNTIKEMKQNIEKESTDLGKTQVIYHNTLQEVKNIFTNTRENNPVNPEKLIPYIQEIIDYAEKSPTNLAVLTQLEEYDFDTFRHSVNVSLLSILYGQDHNYSRQKLTKLAFGAMLHDIGKIFIPEKIVKKEGHLTEEEYEIVKIHPQWGFEALDELRVDDAIKNMAYEHHERPDCSGYPDGTDNIHAYSRIISVFDVYDALISRRVYKNRLSPTRAFWLLNQEFGGYPETSKIVRSLLHCLGIFPVGSIVKLTNGELAVVKKVNRDDLLHPIVTILEVENKQEIGETYDVDLEKTQDSKSIYHGELYDDNVEIEKVLPIEKAMKITDENLFEVLKHQELGRKTIV